jgi:hypothetical protein
MLADKEVRENQLKETTRHNTEMEDLERERNRYQEQLADAQTEWYKFQAHWKSEYEAKYKEWELALEEDKLRIQDELMQLQDRKQRTDADYQNRIATAETLKAQTAEFAAQKEAEFKDWTKSKEWAQLGLSGYQLAIKEKEIEFQRSIQHEQNLFNYEIGKERNQIAKDFNVAKIDFDYVNLLTQREQFNANLAWQKEYSNLNLAYQYANLDFAKYQYDTTGQKLQKAQSFNLISGGIVGRDGYVGTIFNGLDFGIKLGGAYGTSKSAIKVAEALLFK